MIMKKLLQIITTAFVLIFCVTGVAQASNDQIEQEQIEKEAKKAAEEKRDSLTFLLVQRAVESRQFAILADRVRDQYGRTVNVNSSTNFVLLQGDDATIQLAFENGRLGFNGLGGITLEGKASNVKVDYDKKGNLRFSMMVMGAAISANVTFSIPKGSNNCDATVSANMNSTRITFSGKLSPYKKDQ